MVFLRPDLDDFLIEKNCVGFFNPPITLKSGRKGYYYINIRDAIATVEGLEKISGYVYQHAINKGLKPDYFLGIPDGATQIGAEATKMIDYIPKEKLLNTTLRNKPKDHGDPKDKYSVGNLPRGSHAVIVEDVSTTGISGEPYILNLQEGGVIIDRFISVTSRLERRDDGRTVEEAYMDKYGIPVSSLTDISTLLPMAVKKNPPSKETLENSENYAKQYCSCPLKF
ncbi:MAG: hypothetical protein V1678_02030 [Candidatus Aenigmatarchaeota archaeon]